MTPTRLSEIIPVLQVAVGPVILISGVGLLLLSLTNRFGRAVDRARQLRRDLRDASDIDRRQLIDQVDNLYHRAQLIQTSIILATVSVLFAALLIVTLFVEALSRSGSAAAIILLFVLCLTSLILSLITFILDIRLSLTALRMELGRH